MSDDENHLQIAAPIDTESAGHGGEIAVQAVVRVICTPTNSSGTGFLHHSGGIITAEHVIRRCHQAILVLPNGSQVPATVAATDPNHDLALLQPQRPVNATPLAICGLQSLSIGTQVSTWGFPGGYRGASPMLSVGYLAAKDARRTASGKIIEQWVVNAAFNSGNSGGPLLLIETGEVIGVVSSKLAPISPEAASALTALENQGSGFEYTAIRADGSTFKLSEGQIVAKVLHELRRQVQLVIGYAVLLDDIRTFLNAHGINP
jgi:S1-C subfamily serine protease